MIILGPVLLAIAAAYVAWWEWGKRSARRYKKQRGLFVVFSAEQAAATLWTFGEDALIDHALAIGIDDLRVLWGRAGDHWPPNHGLPLNSAWRRDKLIALVCIQFLEGRMRPLAQERRRPRTSMPSHLQNARPVPIDAVHPLV